MKKRNTIAGFSLLEILVTTGIILVLTSIGVISYANANKRSRDTRRINDIQQLRTSLEMYRSDYGYYPAINPGAFNEASNLKNELVSSYIQSIPDDPQTGASYQFQAFNDSGSPPKYYSYCICADLEVGTGVNDCGIVAPGSYDYCQKNP